ncbi:hypothetical protein DPMN_019996 [Dreissena polymorpha]|uniref:Uncharacterized protein n=1 Tax=Dreissena polymorpha TaxID=45954 RepID=A0A9D4S7T8_DREPO|nr:hypothetical protein DPMN_019996 [Dreissena polymorpha]
MLTCFECFYLDYAIHFHGNPFVAMTNRHLFAPTFTRHVAKQPRRVDLDVPDFDLFQTLAD